MIRLAPDMGHHVDVCGLGPQRACRAGFPASTSERIELKVTHRIFVRDLVDGLLRQSEKAYGQLLGSVRPRSLAVRKVRFPTDVVDIEPVEKPHAHFVRYEATQNLIMENLTGRTTLRWLVIEPGTVLLIDPFGLLQEVGNPPDIPFGQ